MSNKLQSVQKATVKYTREHLSDLLGMVHYANKEVTIEKNGEPYAVLVNPIVLEEYKNIVNEKFYQTAQEMWKANEEFLQEEIEADVEKARNEVYETQHGDKK